MITIMLDQAAIEEALTNYIGETTLGVDLSEKEITIKLIAGRKENGLRAEVSIAPQSESSDTTDQPSENDADTKPAAAEEVNPEKVVEAPDFFSDDD